MKKIKFNKDLVIIIALFALLVGWGPLYNRFFKPPAPPVLAEPAVVSVTDTNTAAAALAPTSEAKPAATPAAPATTVAEEKPAWGPSRPVVRPAVAEQVIALSNAVVSVNISSFGAGIVSVELSKFPMMLSHDSGPVRLDFGSRPSLSYVNLQGLNVESAFALESSPTSRSIRAVATAPNGVRLERTVTLKDGYLLSVRDVLINTTTSAVIVDEHGLQVGPMGLLPGEVRGKSDTFFGIDTLATGGGEKVKHWNSPGIFGNGGTLADFFQPPERRGGGCSRKPPLAKPLPREVAQRVHADLEWLAVKTRFFVQILTPNEGGTGCDLQATRWTGLQEQPDDSSTWAEKAHLEDVAAVLRFSPRSLAPGESFAHELNYYVGPREYSTIRTLGNHQDEVMEFGMWKWFAGKLVISLNYLYKFIPNYGIAIILITLIIRIIFWPITHKGTESMKRLQALQPQIMELRQRYKDKPQKMQQEMMALYKEHKVNPMGGCLPMLIQIPVFIALFNVLRSDIGLRFAGFLWVHDLSEPENMLLGIMPFGLGLNILPLYMAATMAWQQKLTPAMGDPAQQKIMMFMPVMMLVFFYTMPSGLVLYWSVNQTMMIIQLLWQRWRSKPSSATTLPKIAKA